jgi:hypothetical protein
MKVDVERECLCTIFAALMEVVVIEGRVVVFAFAYISPLLLCI